MLTESKKEQSISNICVFDCLDSSRSFLTTNNPFKQIHIYPTCRTIFMRTLHLSLKFSIKTTHITWHQSTLKLLQPCFLRWQRTHALELDPMQGPRSQRPSQTRRPFTNWPSRLPNKMKDCNNSFCSGRWGQCERWKEKHNHEPKPLLPTNCPNQLPTNCHQPTIINHCHCTDCPLPPANLKEISAGRNCNMWCCGHTRPSTFRAGGFHLLCEKWRALPLPDPHRTSNLFAPTHTNTKVRVASVFSLLCTVLFLASHTWATFLRT